MNTPLITWICIAVAALLICIVRIINVMNHRRELHHRHPLVEVGRVWEEFYIPGDPVNTDDTDDFDQ